MQSVLSASWILVAPFWRYQVCSGLSLRVLLCAGNKTGQGLRNFEEIQGNAYITVVLPAFRSFGTMTNLVFTLDVMITLR